MRTTIPRHRAARAQLGVLEDVCGTAGGGLVSAPGDVFGWRRSYLKPKLDGEEENAAAAADPSKKPPADLEPENIRAAYRREPAEAARQAAEASPVFPELKTAIAEYAKFSFRVHFPGPIRQVPGYDDVAFQYPRRGYVGRDQITRLG